ncbi:MAG: SUMF1/EgtB/PvdO family nonheme iron enzyme, partial [Gammaproteobacteria bacterium]|nr:SUMF1/EgtB/PvdO family nonheme iron enzyme [Gammaproteobacteria bacterium]
GLVHSDLKPGNCFYTKDGTIKLLDFGIARASKTKADADGETTLFDPSELGALTPTYATVEMFEGIYPDPRDDIYALSIMTYQLLTGRHPYGKKAAPKARELGLKPEPISKLNKRQNKALMRGLAFEREHRTPTVEEFFDSVRPKKSRAPMIIAASLAAMVIIGVGAYDPVADLISHYRREQIISIIEQPGIEKIRQGLDVAPNFEELGAAVSSYEVEVKNRQLEIALRKLFESTGDIDVEATRASMEKLKGDIPDRYPDLRQEFAETRGNQILGLANSKDLRISSLDRRMHEYQAMFPEEAPNLHKTVASIVEKRIRAVQISSVRDLEALSVPLTEFRAFSSKDYASLSKDLSSQIARQIRSLEKTDKFAAVALLEASIKQFGEGPFRSIDIELPMKEVSEGMKLIVLGRLTAAQVSLAGARKKDPTHSDLSDFERALQSAMDKAKTEYQKYTQAAASSRSTRDQSKFDNHYAAIQQLWSDNPEFRRIQVAPPRRGECSNDLAGYGRRRGGECWDLMGRTKGPLLVVVPAGGSIGKPFAITKYEISGSDFNDYCKATGSCTSLARSKAKLPLTSVSVQEVEAYAQWLSQEASKAEKRKVVYRLPTEEEWEHAARAAGVQPKRKYNCRVTAGGGVISGHDLVDAASGAQNGWGLANYVGNAQEWVRSAGGLKARGGTYEDPLTRCDISISRNHSGQPDHATGFRLVREMG